MVHAILEPTKHPGAVSSSAFVSAALHVALIGAAIVATGDSTGLPSLDELNPAYFLIPPNQRPQHSGQATAVDLGALASTPVEQTPGPPLKTAAGKVPGGGKSTAAPGQAAEYLPSVASAGVDSVYTVLFVDSPATRYEGSTAPAYPPDLQAAGIEGVVYAQFVVDTLGGVDTASVRILTSSHPGFTASVMQALSGMRFHPASVGNQRVRQLVEQHYQFVIVPPDRLSS